MNGCPEFVPPTSSLKKSRPVLSQVMVTAGERYMRLFGTNRATNFEPRLQAKAAGKILPVILGSALLFSLLWLNGCAALVSGNSTTQAGTKASFALSPTS